MISSQSLVQLGLQESAHGGWSYQMDDRASLLSPVDTLAGFRARNMSAVETQAVGTQRLMIVVGKSGGFGSGARLLSRKLQARWHPQT